MPAVVIRLLRENDLPADRQILLDVGKPHVLDNHTLCIGVRLRYQLFDV